MDFMGNFEYVEICNMAPVDGVKAWSVECAHGSWVKGVNAGGSRNELESFATNSQVKTSGWSNNHDIHYLVHIVTFFSRLVPDDSQ